MSDERTATTDAVRARYEETETERRLTFERTANGADGAGGASATAAIAQNREGYAMLTVRPTADGEELERYYGLEMALDHAAELLGVPARELPLPAAGEDMGL